MNSSGKPRSHSWWIRFLLLPLGLFYRLWTKSLRMDFLSPEDEAILKDSESPAIILLWHNRLFVAGEWHGRFRSNRKCYGLISGSRDGAWLESFYGWSGILAVRGSRNKRGASALRELARVIKNGNDVGITPDGAERGAATDRPPRRRWRECHGRRPWRRPGRRTRRRWWYSRRRRRLGCVQ